MPRFPTIHFDSMTIFCIIETSNSPLTNDDENKQCLYDLGLQHEYWAIYCQRLSGQNCNKLLHYCVFVFRISKKKFFMKIVIQPTVFY